MSQKLVKIFGSNTKAQEIVLLLHEAKEVVRQGFYDSELYKVEQFCKENQIHIVKSKFKILFADDYSGNYSNKGIRIPENDSRSGMNFFYFSKDEQKSWLAAYYELIGNDSAFGSLLGYPKCCVEYFLNSFSGSNPNPQQVGNNPYTNISKRDKDLVLISHFPCKSECKESTELARKNLMILKNNWPDRAATLISELND
jgi:hypothetical protein